MGTMNNQELKRMQEAKILGVQKGFPVFLLTVWDCKTGDIEQEIFFTHRGLQEAIQKISHECKLYVAQIKCVKDVKKVSYETN